MLSLCRGHASLCILPILVYVLPKRALLAFLKQQVQAGTSSAWEGGWVWACPGWSRGPACPRTAGGGLFPACPVATEPELSVWAVIAAHLRPCPHPSSRCPCWEGQPLGLAARGTSTASLCCRQADAAPRGLRRIRCPPRLSCGPAGGALLWKMTPNGGRLLTVHSLSLRSLRCLRSYGLLYARLPYFSGVCSNSCPLCSWCHLSISSSVSTSPPTSGWKSMA